MGPKKSELNYKRDTAPYDPDTGPPYSKRISAGEIERDIQHTRSHMDHVVDELGQRLQPRELMNELTDMLSGPRGERVRDSVSGAGRRISDAVRSQPISVSLITAGVLMMLSHDRRAQNCPEGVSSSSRWQWREKAGHVRDKAGGAVGSVREKIHDRREHMQERKEERQQRKEERHQKAQESRQQLRERMGEQRQHMRDQADRFRSRLSESRQHMGERMDHARDSLGHGKDRIVDTAHEHPLSMGLAALGAGLLVGLLVPSSRREEEMWGEESEELWDAAETASEDAEIAAREDVSDEDWASESDDWQRQAG